MILKKEKSPKILLHKVKFSAYLSQIIFFLVKFFQLLLIHFLLLRVSILQAQNHAKSLFFLLANPLTFCYNDVKNQ